MCLAGILSETVGLPALRFSRCVRGSLPSVLLAIASSELLEKWLVGLLVSPFPEFGATDIGRLREPLTLYKSKSRVRWGMGI